MPVTSLNTHSNQSNAEKITAANISLEWLKHEVKKMTDEQQKIRLMLLEIMEQTKPYEIIKEEETEEEPVKSWFWSTSN